MPASNKIKGPIAISQQKKLKKYPTDKLLHSKVLSGYQPDLPGQSCKAGIHHRGREGVPRQSFERR